MRKKIVLLFFFIIILLTGCKKKADMPVASSSVAEKSIANTRVFESIREIPIKTNNIKEDLQNPKIFNNISTMSIITKNKKMPSKDNNDIIVKLFKNEEDINKVKQVIYDLENEEFKKIYKDFKVGKYKSTLFNLINYNEELFARLSRNAIKNNFAEYKKYIIKFFDNNKYNNFNTEVKNIVIKYNENVNEIAKLYDSANFRLLLNNLNKGKYYKLIEELKDIILKEEYSSIIQDFINEMIDGNLTDEFYDLIYNSIEIIYEYCDEIYEQETQVVTITETTEATEAIKTETEDANTNQRINLIIIIVVFVMVAIFGLLIFINKNRKKELNYE